MMKLKNRSRDLETWLDGLGAQTSLKLTDQAKVYRVLVHFSAEISQTLEQHRPTGSKGEHVCASCDNAWPCDTVSLVERLIA